VDDQDPETSLFGPGGRLRRRGRAHLHRPRRKAWLKGLSPKENRDLPPLDYPLVYRLKAERPDLTVIINGGVPGLDAAEAHLARVDGVMLGPRGLSRSGRAGRRRPAPVRGAGPDVESLDGGGALPALCPGAACARRGAAGDDPPMLGLFHGRPGARTWRRILTVEGVRPGAGPR